MTRIIRFNLLKVFHIAIEQTRLQELKIHGPGYKSIFLQGIEDVARDIGADCPDELEIIDR